MSSLNASETYHLSYPSGAFTNIGGDVSYVGTAYTFGVKDTLYQLWAWGYNSGDGGTLGQNNAVQYSSPVQIPGTTWSIASAGSNMAGAIKTDGTLWAWGYNHQGRLGQNDAVQYSSPVQVPGTEWTNLTHNIAGMMAIQNDQTP